MSELSNLNWESFKNKQTEELEKIDQFLNPGERQPKALAAPYYASGARCFVKLGGRPIGVCQDFKWSVGYDSQPINTVDTVFPWDIEVGQARISATLNKIMNPLKGPEAENLFPIMSAAVHQPMVELQVIYKAKVVDSTQSRANPNSVNLRGERPEKPVKYIPMEFSMFFARGMFTSISSGVSVGQLSYVGATFLGVAYQHYVSQAFVPYGFSYIAQETLAAAQELIGGWTGGFM